MDARAVFHTNRSPRSHRNQCRGNSVLHEQSRYQLGVLSELGCIGDGLADGGVRHERLEDFRS